MRKFWPFQGMSSIAICNRFWDPESLMVFRIVLTQVVRRRCVENAACLAFAMNESDWPCQSSGCSPQICIPYVGCETQQNSSQHLTDALLDRKKAISLISGSRQG